MKTNVLGLAYITKCFLLAQLFLGIGNASAQNVNFNQSSLDFKNFSSINNGTSLIFGPDERLYASQLNGDIKIYTILQSGPNQYEVVGQETLIGIKQIPNHDDNGQPAFDKRKNRQITGITVTGPASNPVIYAGSSDPKWGGPSGDKALDTNSGVITSLTWSGTAWEMMDLVRGLPRSEENHSLNGMEFTFIKGRPFLLVAVGGFTNAGAPSKNFAYITEYALSAAIISVDLEAIEAMPTKIDPISGRKYKYDLPTLDDPSRPNKNNVYDPNHPSYDGIDVGDPFGGNDGLNMAMIVKGGPIQIFSPGYRNAFDFVVTENMRVYATDNGANGGWGGLPEFESDSTKVTNQYLTDEPGSTKKNPSTSGEYVDNQDHLLLITKDINSYTFGAFYGGHPTPIRANPGSPYQIGSNFPYTPGGANLFTKFIGDNDNWININPDFTPVDTYRTKILKPIPPGAPGFDEYAGNSLPANWPPVPLSMANGAEADFRAPSLFNPNGPQPEIVTLLPTNSNAIDEYKASNFNGALKGSLIIGKSGGDLHVVNLNPDGSLKTLETNKWNLNGGNPLGISCNGDNMIFPGTIWVATFDNRIMILTPADNVTCLSQDNPNFDPLADYDFDGYTNQDEIDNGTDYCSGASMPNDYDKDFVSDLNDLDDDGDGIPDHLDPFQIGDPRDLPINNELFSNQLDDKNRQSGYLGLGLTGLMNNGNPNPNWLEWLDNPETRVGPADIYGGAAGAIQVSMVGGTANGPSNNQKKGFQFGVNVGEKTGKFIITGGMLGLSSTGQLYDFEGDGEVGIQIGDGSQSNFIKFVFTSTHIVVAQENNDIPDPNPIMKPLTENERPKSDIIDLIFEIDPETGKVEPFYKFGDNAKVSLGTIQSMGNVKNAIQKMEVPLAIGIYGTSNDDEKSFIAVWDYFRVIGERPFMIREMKEIQRVVNDPELVINLEEYFGDNDGIENLTFSVENNSDPKVGASINNNTLTLKFPGIQTTSQITIRATDTNGLFLDQTFTVIVKPNLEVVLRINAGGILINDSSANPDWLANNSSGAVTTELYSVNNGSLAKFTYSKEKRHHSIPTYIDDDMYIKIFGNERFSSSAVMKFDIPLSNGEYLVNLYMGNGFNGTSSVGQRVFDVAVEGETKISQLDLSAKYGHLVGAMEQIPVSLSDGVLNISFIKKVENTLVNGIEIIKVNGGAVKNPIVFTPVADQHNTAGEELDGSLIVVASGGEGNLNYSAIGLPPSLLIEPTNGVIYGQISEDAQGNSPYYVTITIDDEDGSSSNAVSFNFKWTISASTTGDTWQIKNEAQEYTARHENSFVQAGDKFYLLGGRENAKTIDIYDYAADTWTSLENISPHEFNHFQALEYQGLIWVIGAFKNNSFPSEAPADHIWAFDPITQEWIQGPAIPSGRKRGSAGVVMYKDKFYIVNGNTKGHDGGFVNYFDEYDPLTGAWTALENSPRARDHFFSAVIGNKMYVASGRLSGGTGGTFGPVISEVDVYNFDTKAWSTLPSDQNLPTPRAGAIVNNYKDKLIIAGGEVPDKNDAHSIAEMYDPNSESWQLLNPMNFPRHGTQGIVSGRGLYVLGGSPKKGGGRQKNMEVYGFDEPQGTPLVASEIILEKNIKIVSNSTGNAGIQIGKGTSGIFITSVKITGIDASDYLIQSGELNNVLLKANSKHELVIKYNGSKEFSEAAIEISYGKDSVKYIQLNSGSSNVAPIVLNPVPDKTVFSESSFSFTFAENTFFDQDGDDLTFTASLSNGAVLPTWLNFSGTTRTFSGTPLQTDIGNYSIELTASDGNGGSVRDDFTLTVKQKDPVPNTAFRTNSGGPEYTTITKNVFSADHSFSGGKIFANNKIKDISNTEDDLLYKSERTGRFTYNFPLPTGTYLIRLHFAEIWFGATGGGIGEVGKRVFNVRCEGQPLLTNFDIFAEVGAMTALIKDFEVNVLDGELNLEFIRVIDNPKISAIEILSKNNFEEGELSASPSDLNFNKQKIGSFSENKITLTNKGTTSVEIRSVSVTGSKDFSHNFSGVINVDGGASTDISVVFNPTTTGMKTAEISIVHTAANPALVIGLRGEGTEVANASPSLVNPMPDQKAQVGEAFNFTFDENTFFDPDGDELSYTATLTGGAVLPAWLKFNGSTRTFSGTPAEANVGTLNILVTADDGKGGSASDIFELQVEENIPENNSPVLMEPIADQKATVGEAFVFTFAENTFFDPDGDELRYTATLTGGAVLPAWLKFNGSTRTFSGIPGEANVGTLDILVTADDGKGGSANDIFGLEVEENIPENNSPVLMEPIADQKANVGKAFVFTFAENTFFDPDGDELSYTVTLTGGAVLPAWLKFNGSTRTFSGTPGEANVGTTSIVVNASDGSLSASDHFDILVENNVAVAIRLNTGGGELNAYGGTFEADQFFVGGKRKTYGKSTNISNTPDQELYRTERFENFNYNVPLPSGTYIVRLHFAEIKFSGRQGGSGKRVFNVISEGLPLLTNFDIFKEAGSTTALIKEFEINVKDGALNLAFEGVVDVPTISAIQIIAKTDKLLLMEGSRIMDEPSMIIPISTEEAKGFIKVFPNPFEDVININISAEEPQEYAVKIYDVLGRIHFEGNFSSKSSELGNYSIDLSNNKLNPGGLFLVHIESRSGKHIKTIKMIKK